MNFQFVNPVNNVDMSGKIYISTDMFNGEKVQNSTPLTLLNRLNQIDNLAKDKNGSQSLPFFSNEKSSEKNEDNTKFLSSEKNSGKLINLYA